jgi:hypothetical protein
MSSPHHPEDPSGLGDDRPYVSLYWQHLLEEAEDAWDDAITLYSIWSEATHRVKRNSASRAQNVIDIVQPRLVELLGNIFPREPDPPLGDNSLDTTTWPQDGLLKHMGYTAGQHDPGTSERRRILRRIFFGPIPNVLDAAYMQQWGRDKSTGRLRKLAWTIASFANNRLRANHGRPDSVADNWCADLEWLRKEIYEGYFDFPWPPVPGIKWR